MTEPLDWRSLRSRPNVGRISATSEGVLSVPGQKAYRLEDQDASAVRIADAFLGLF
jgi:hypothetical protein